MIVLDDIRMARARIADYIRSTPLVKAAPVKKTLPFGHPVYLKLESMQITGSFKARGAVSKLTTLHPDQLKHGIITASGGNHGLGVAYAGWLAKIPTTIYLSQNATPSKVEKIAAWGAKVIVEGALWDDANKAALATAEHEYKVYFHAFMDPAVIAGQGTIALELLEQLPDADTLVIAIGGGGLISGMSLAAKALNPHIRIIGVEPIGAPTLYESLRQNAVIELSNVNTRANTLAPRQSAQINLDIIRDNVDEIVLVSDEEMREAAVWLWQEMGIAAELSGAAALAALLTERIQVGQHDKVVVLVCGAGTDGILE